jgi:N-acetylglucosaminyl-diphospho-decaprenol L-rhamnosyltransferase
LTPFSIVVVTWNSAADLDPLLASFAEHLRAGYEAIIVDNASEDATVEVAAGWDGPKQVLPLQENRGFGTASNAGVEAARHDAVVLLNPDTLLVDGSLAALAKGAAATRALWGPELLNEDGSRQPSASPPPASWEVGLDALVPAALLPRPLRFRCEPWRSREIREVGWLTGACIAARRDVLLELGPFDEALELYAEDLDLGLRARELGIRSFFAPNVARVVHRGGGSARQRFADDGATTKIQTRREVVRRRLGPRRELYDYGAQLVFNGTRLLAKRALGRPVERERRWFSAARRR